MTLDEQEKRAYIAGDMDKCALLVEIMKLRDRIDALELACTEHDSTAYMIGGPE